MSTLSFDIHDPSYLTKNPVRYGLHKQQMDCLTHYYVQVTGAREDIIRWVEAEFICHRDEMNKHLNAIKD